MHAWKIHLCWGLVAIVTAGAWGRWVAAHHETDRDLPLAASAAPPKETPPLRSDPGAQTVHTPLPGVPASQLQLLPDPADVPVDVIRARLKSSDVDDLFRAIQRILLLKDPALKRDLLFECVRSSHPQVRQRGMVELVREVGDDAIPVVQGILVSDPQDFVQACAAEQLGKMADKGSTALLLDAFQRGGSGLKLAAAAALYRFGTPGPAAEILPGLTADLDSPDGADRKAAVLRIGRLQAPIAIPALTRALGDSSGEVRAKAIVALSEIDAPEVPALLEPLLQDPWIDARDGARVAIQAYRRRHPK